jgi:hypothetical protein
LACPLADAAPSPNLRCSPRSPHTQAESTGAGGQYIAPIHAIAAQYNVKVVAYEAGPGWGVGTATSVGQYILAGRMKQMRALTAQNVQAWANFGPYMDVYNHFSIAGQPSRYGMWGHAETYFNVSAPKWCAVIDTTGANPAEWPECNYTST